jgi:CheY-like chemotaxis protein
MTMTTMTPVIAYIDDEPLLGRVFRRIFEGTGAPVETFTDPELALAYTRTHPIAAIVCDYRMPTLNGLDVLARLEIDVPFILVSGDISIASIVGDNPRITHVLPKPFQPEALLSLLQAHVSPAIGGGKG